MLQENNIKIMLFTILCICFTFYLFLGIHSYNRNKKSRINVIFFILCVFGSIWTIGYAFMLISPNIEIANRWRIVALFGGCFFNGIWMSFVFSLNDINAKKSSSRKQYLVYIPSIIFFASNLIDNPSKVISSEPYGFVNNLYFTTPIGIVFSIYLAALLIAGFVISYFQMKILKKNRIRKQMKIILITSLISFCLGAIPDLICPALGIMVFPYGLIAMSIGMSGMWYAINKYKMMSISYELISKYLFETIHEPIFILGEDFLVRNCNEASLNITGYNHKELEQHSLDTIINYRNFNLNTIMQTGNAMNIEVDLHKKNKGTLICELSATVIYDEYKDLLGILILLHDVSERKSIAEIQKKYTLKLALLNLSKSIKMITNFLSLLSNNILISSNIFFLLESSVRAL